MGRHAMRLDVYLASYGRGREKGRQAERGAEREKGETEAASLRGKRKRKRVRLQAGRKIYLPQRMGEGVDVVCLLKGLDRSLHP